MSQYSSLFFCLPRLAVAFIVAALLLPLQRVLCAVATTTGKQQALVTASVNGSSSLLEDVHPEQLMLQQLLGLTLAGHMYVNTPIVSPLLVTPTDDSTGPRPSFSHVYSLFGAGQKGTDPRRPGVWFRHDTTTLVLSYHFGCPVKIYKLSDTGLSSELLGNPLENAAFRPTIILWAGTLQSVESLCEHMFTLVSYVSVTGWTVDGSENWNAERVAAQYPLQTDEIRRLGSDGFNADQRSLQPSVYSGDWPMEK